MAQKLRRSLFIGLGGTGLNSILQTKKRIIETYGEVPPMFGFLAIDTDKNEFNKTLVGKLEAHPVISLDASERQYLSVSAPQAIYNGPLHSLFSWMPECNVSAMQTILYGAGQVRTTGRFAQFCNYDTLYNTLNNKIAQICNADIKDNPKYELANNSFEIHMAFSFGGGTGSGIFIDVAYIIKKLMNNLFVNLDCKMFGYAVLPDVFAMMGGGGAGMARVRPNGYGALLDVDFLMHLPPNAPVEIDYGNGNIINTNEIQISKPFDVLMLIDNKDQSGNIYNNIDDLAELVSLSLTMGGSELGQGLQSVMDNIVVNIEGGMMDVGNKKAWASGLGVCELYFDGNKLGNIYAEKVINRLINEGLLNSCGDNNNKVNAWIDAPNVMIRENNNRDDVIDKLLNPIPNILFTDITDEANPTAEIDQYLNTNQIRIDKEKLAQESKKIADNTKAELTKFLIDEVNKDCGIGNVIDILGGIKSQVSIFQKEMSEEAQVFSAKIENLQSQRKSAEAELKTNALKNIFTINRSKKIEESKSFLSNVINNYAQALREKERREYALLFYNDLITVIENYEQSFGDLKIKLQDISKKAEEKANALQNNVNDAEKTFVIELQGEYAKSILLDDIDITVAQFIEHLDGKKIFDFKDMANDLLRDKFWFYAKDLKGALSWRNKSIEEVLEELPKERLDQVILQAIKKSQPLFSFDYQGYAMQIQISTSFFVGVPKKEKSILKIDNNFERQLGSESGKVNFTSTGMQDRIIIYRQIAAVPAYSVNGVKGYEKEYQEKSKSHNFHINKLWEDRMKNEKFSLYPEKAKDDSLELWVKGILFGLIINENGKYKIKSEKTGVGTRKYWVDLGESRIDSFNNFKNNLDLYQEELVSEIDIKVGEMDKTSLDDIIKNAHEDYINQFSQLNMDLNKLLENEDKNKEVLNLLDDEIDYVTKELKA